MNSNYRRVEKALTYLRENYKNQPTLDEVADYIHLSPYHFHRVFKEWAGVTPKKFLQYITLNQAKKRLIEDISVEDATLQAGLSSSSRLHDLFVTFEGITPGEFKKRGENLKIYYALHESPFGRYFLGLTNRGICSLTFTRHMDWILDNMRKKWPNADFQFSPTQTKPVANKLFSFSQKNKKSFNVLVEGNSYQLKIWEALLNIPFGSLITYEKLAEYLGIEINVTSIESVLTNNPVRYLIPCHRVIKDLTYDDKLKWGNVHMLSMIGWEASKMNLK